MRKKSGKKQNKESMVSFKGIDLTIVFVALFLSVFCLVFVYSALSVENGTTKVLGIEVASSFKTLVFTFGYIVVGFIGMFAIAAYNYRGLETRKPFLFAIISNPLVYYVPSCLFFVFIEIMQKLDAGDPTTVYAGFGTLRVANGACRWINIIPYKSFSYQPSEVIKLLLIICFSIVIFNAGMMLQRIRGMALYLILAGVPSAFVLFFSSDLSSSIVVFATLFIMMAVAGNNWKKTGIVVVFFILMAILAMALLIIPNKGKPESEIHPYQAKRILAWLYPDEYPATSDQTTQAKYAIGSGGLLGEGIGNSMQKIKKLPEAQNDMIFALICEELGLFGGLLVLSLYFVMLFRMFLIANEAEDLFDRMVVVGVMSHVGLQVLINVCVVTGLFPNTGLPLPLISAGGSSIVFMYAELGFVLNVGKRIGRE